MDDLIAARFQMGLSLGFHIVFACIGMIMPVLMAYSEWKWIRTNKQVYYDIAKAWSKGVAIFFAVGAVSGTVLAFELGLLFPEFMKHAGPIIGMPFSWEGTAFFIEAIALGVFLYGWKKLNKWVHWLSGIVVGVSGIMSGIFVVAANAWMNCPAGFTWQNGKPINIDPVTAMFNNAWFQEALHMILAAFIATSFAVAGVHAFLLLKKRGNIFHTTAIKIALSFGVVAAFLQPISGDISAKNLAKYQPAKLAALESLYKTTKSADILIGGIPLGLIAVEAGWIVTEVGRQPWIIYGVMKTKDAVSYMPGLRYSFYVITVIYILLTTIIIWLMQRQIGSLEKNYPSAVTINN